MYKDKINIGLLFRYATTGLSVALFQITSFYVLSNILRLEYLTASTIAFCLTIIISFFMQRQIVFVVSGKRAIAAQYAFIILTINSIFGLGVNCFIMYGGVEYLNGSALFWQVISMTVLASYNFFFYRYVFRPLTQ